MIVAEALQDETHRTVRIVAGKYRRRKLEANPGLTTRPISDFVKESLFEQIQHCLVDARVADIFSGTGTIGLEALSRGARSAIFVEQDAKAFELLKKNIATLGVQNETMCWRTDAVRCSYRPKHVETLLPCDAVFFDPPYKMIEDLQPGSPLYKSIQRIGREEFTAPEALLIVRTPSRSEFELPAMWQRWDELPAIEFSTMTIHLFRKTAIAESENHAEESQGDSDEPGDDEAP